jgi:hypothetical protein
MTVAAHTAKRLQSNHHPSNHFLYHRQNRSTNSRVVSHTGIAGAVDSQETTLPDYYDRDPDDTQRVQVAIASVHTSSTCDEDYDDADPSQLS